MNQFTDAQGRAWNIVLNVGVMRRVKAEAGIDLGGFFDQEMFTRLFISDTILVGEVLAAICRPNFEAHKIDENAFLEGLNGDVINNARKALQGAFVDFCPSQDREMMSAVFDGLAKRMQTAKAAAKKHIQKELAKDAPNSGAPSGDAPESSE